MELNDDLPPRLKWFAPWTWRGWRWVLLAGALLGFVTTVPVVLWFGMALAR